MTLIDWHISQGLVPYEQAVSAMETRVADIRAGKAPEQIWLLEHPPLYTAGTSARPEDLVTARFPVHETGRGGQYTYHGPGQRVAYVMLDLRARQASPDVKKYVWQLEEWIIQTLAYFGITGERRDGRVGIWVVRGSREDKIAAIGVRIRQGVTYHGLSININPDLSHFNGIVPCGIAAHGVTSFQDLGKNITMAELDDVLKQTFKIVFG
ncbi:MAG: lipoyl(octanoyl) transferase LipB [Alphaproteobacteria bacterium]|nr:lipoyl(octanoyl) transferase LipB [Alphaproteobacteria bacterium]